MAGSKDKPGTSFFSQKVYGAPVWAIVAVVGLVALMLVLRSGGGSSKGGSSFSGGDGELKHKVALVAQGMTKEVNDCWDEERNGQVQNFKKFNTKYSSCSSYEWMGKWQVLQPEGKKVVVDVGCGYGMASAAFVGAFVPELGLSRETLAEALTKTSDPPSLKEVCGLCHGHKLFDSDEDVCTHAWTPQATRVPHEVQVHCVEPSSGHAATLKEARAAILGSEADTVTKDKGKLTWQMHAPLALADFTGTASFPKDCDANSCTLSKGNKSAAGMVSVKVTTLDDFLDTNKIKSVDMLRISAEGFDPEILQGAGRTISNRVPGVVVFDYRRDGVWVEPSHHLSKLVASMQRDGYACYFDGSPLVFKLSHKCWDKVYEETGSWTSVVCARLNHPVYSILEYMSHQYAMFDEVRVTGGEWTETHEELEKKEAKPAGRRMKQ